ncbi:hypothetical protein B0F90DRAFT_1766021 [Multifurca ochricompacta]|uniref:Uncharacterized protein n=1 Tax=Multifurca ochricompacta TaxID=376703 RepID=A0AAD4LY73_9AGAM|nr:hypothetical protein B0F90DRAFT_1766021 [Multifurca ochricompacta]
MANDNDPAIIMFPTRFRPFFYIIKSKAVLIAKQKGFNNFHITSRFAARWSSSGAISSLIKFRRLGV